MSFNIKKMRKFLLLLAGSTRLLTRVTQQGEQALIDNFFKVNACTNISLKRVTIAVIQPGLKSNPESCNEFLRKLRITFMAKRKKMDPFPYALSLLGTKT